MGRRPRPSASPLRHARIQHEVSLSEMATRIHFSKQYLSQVELGAVRPSAQIVEAYARELNLDPGVLRPRDLGAVDLLSAVRAGLSAPATAQSDFPSLSSEPVIEGSRNVIAQATAMLAAAARHPLPGAEVILSITSEEDLLRNLPDDSVRQWEMAIQRLLLAKYDLVHLRPFSDDEFARRRLLRRILKWLPFGSYRPASIMTNAAGAPPMDLLLVPGQGALIFVSTYESAAVRSAFYFPSDGQQYQILTQYVSSMQVLASPMLRVYPSRSLEFDFAILDAHSVDRHPGPQSLLKEGLSSVHIPGWVDSERLQRYLHVRRRTLGDTQLLERRTEIATLLGNRRLRTGHFLERATRWPVHQITSQEALIRVLETGEAPADDTIVPFEQPLTLIREEAIATIQLLIERLHALPYFELALLPADVAESLDDGLFKTSWQVTGSEIAIVESWRHRPDGNREEVDIALYEPHIVRTLRDHFAALWDAIPIQYRQRDRVVAHLHELIALVRPAS